MIITSLRTIQNHEYIDFVKEFIISYQELLNEKIGLLSEAIIQRIINDAKSKAQTEDLFTQKLMNILLQVSQNKLFMGKYAAQFEIAYMPIFEFMVDPSKITFEDSILCILKNFIKKQNGVSDIIY